MSANFLHGVETVILNKGPKPVRGVKSAVIAIVGTAPMLDVAAANRTLNSPQLILNDRDAAKYFGADRAGFTIPQALSAIFAQGNGPICVVVNALDPATDTTVIASEVVAKAADGTFKFAQPNVSSVTVTLPATCVLGTDYTIDAANGIISRVEVSTKITTATASITVGYTYLDPAKCLAADIVGSTDVNGNRLGLLALKDCYAKFGFFPKIIICPGFSSTAAVLTQMDSVAASIRAIAIADLAAGTTVAAAITSRGAGGAANSSSKRLVFCYPYVKRYNTTTAAEETVPYSQFYAGVLAAKDMANGYWWSPSNTEIKGITGVERQLTAMINDPTSEVNTLNEVGITTIFNSFGTGYRVWGNRSASFPAYTDSCNFVSVQRTADMIHESVEYSMLQFIDYPTNQALIDSISESVNVFIRTLVGRGALIDGKCWYDPADNPAVQISAGQLVFTIDYMPPVPAERITFKSFINIDYLKQLGGK